MFTGIIKHPGSVTRVTEVAGGQRLTIDAGTLATGVHHGDSICVSGVCLTATDIAPPHVTFDVITETLRRTTLGDKRAGSTVNLESSLRVGDSIDGHFVQGHIDGTATLVRRDATPKEHVLWFKPQDALRPYIIPKGSIAIDGVSLTVAAVERDRFSVALIPTTLELTTLNDLKEGEHVNIETDIISRTVVHQLQHMTESGGLTLETLKTQGFA